VTEEPHRALLHVGELMADQLNAIVDTGMELRVSNNGMLIAFENNAYGVIVVVRRDHDSDGARWVAELR
jgi:hypothetical protein